MRFYLAPLEGITGDIYRTTVMDHFGQGIDACFAPFIYPCDKRALAPRDRVQLCPENNHGFRLIPQVMSDKADAVLELEKELMDLGFDTYNLNMGCPSGTVSSKGRGAGFLKRTEELDRFLDELYAGTSCKISVKTRLGMHDPDEFYEILEIYNRYPISELIIHPRVRDDFYKGMSRTEYFTYAMSHSRMPLCYNGDINSVEDYEARLSEFGLPGEGTDQVPAVMLGRGMIKDPSLIRQLSGGAPADQKELKAFLDQLADRYKERLSGDTPVLYKMKEVWSYLIASFPDHDKTYKKILKSKKLAEYRAAVEELF